MWPYSAEEQADLASVVAETRTVSVPRPAGSIQELLEANIGKDLQYIRFNGMLVGGFVGVALHVLQQTVL